MSDLIQYLFQRPVIIGLAVAGAGLATAGWILSLRFGNSNRGAVWLTRLGYGLALASIVVFIVAGYLSE